MKKLKTTSLSEKYILILHLHHRHESPKTPTLHFLSLHSHNLHLNLHYIHPGRHLKNLNNKNNGTDLFGSRNTPPPHVIRHVSFFHWSHYSSLVTPCLPHLFHTFPFSFHHRNCFSCYSTRSLHN